MTGFSKLSQLFIVAGLVSLATACNDSNSSSKPIKPKPEMVSVAGKIFDDNLVGAKMFMDCNGNLSQDADEVYTESKAGGVFEFTDIPKSTAETCNIVGDIIEGTTRIDGNGEAISQSYKMTAPAGCKYISSLTGMAQSFASQGVPDFLEKTKRKFDLDVDLCSDIPAAYEDESLDPTQKIANIRALRLNNVLSGLTAQNYETMESMIESGDIQAVSAYMMNQERLMRAAPEILAALDDVEAQINAGNDNEAGPQNVLGFTSFWTHWASFWTAIRAAQMPPEPEMLTEEMQLMNLKMNAEQADFSSIYLNSNARLNGFTYLADTNSANEFFLGYESDDVSVSSSTSQPSTLQFDLKQWSNNSFSDGDSIFEGTLILTSDGWENPSDTFNFDRSAISRLSQDNTQFSIENSDLSSFRIIFEARKYSVTERSIQALLEHHSDLEVWNELFGEDLNFPVQASAFDVTIKGANKYYWMYDMGNEECAAELQFSSICNAQEVLSPAEVELDRTTGKWRFRLSKVASFVSFDFLQNDTVPYMPVITSDDDGHIVAYFESNRSVSFIRFPLNLNQAFYKDTGDIDFDREESASIQPSVIATSSWTRAATNDNFIEFSVPGSVKRIDGSLPSNMFFTVAEGMVRFGEVTANNEVLEEDVLGLNTVARDAILNNMDINELTNIINRRDN
ncbi:hypothetical protein JQC92_08120 [Shewanella sp. 202IG2-18]|uniref:hypothetical protein n=1 Tax=Parashewanella hymeniacidonis TaxID=2807618 RepID=UPI001961FF96|nr:hypothetical protein [Parashewanella hymeniacidonis]MBM7071994.1 hypothetical protein [Parashewanella hymeniacidonis]